jgi:hypothetical protein
MASDAVHPADFFCRNIVSRRELRLASHHRHRRSATTNCCAGTSSRDERLRGTQTA